MSRGIKPEKKNVRISMTVKKKGLRNVLEFSRPKVSQI